MKIDSSSPFIMSADFKMFLPRSVHPPKVDVALLPPPPTPTITFWPFDILKNSNIICCTTYWGVWGVKFG